MRLPTASLLGALILAGACPARADAVGPPPTDCPEGARGESCHGNEYCALASCIGPRDCRPGERCVARELCLTSVMCFGWGAGSSATAVLGEDCVGCTDRCESQFVCVGDALDAGVRDAGGRDAGGRDAGGAMDSGPDGDPRHSRYCGCAVPSRHAQVPSLWMGIGAAIALALQRRRARGSA